MAKAFSRPKNFGACLANFGRIYFEGSSAAICQYPMIIHANEKDTIDITCALVIFARCEDVSVISRIASVFSFSSLS